MPNGCFIHVREAVASNGYGAVKSDSLAATAPMRCFDTKRMKSAPKIGAQWCRVVSESEPTKRSATLQSSCRKWLPPAGYIRRKRGEVRDGCRRNG